MSTGQIAFSQVSASGQAFLAEPKRSPRFPGQLHVCLAGVFTGERRAGEFMCIDIFSGIGFAIRQYIGSLCRLVLVEVIKDHGVVGPARAHGIVEEIREPDGAGPQSDGFFEELAQERDRGWAGTVEHAAMRPPKRVVRVHIGFAVSAVATLRGRLPKSARHCIAGNIAPARSDVAFIFALVENHGLAPVGSPTCAELEV